LWQGQEAATESVFSSTWELKISSLSVWLQLRKLHEPFFPAQLGQSFSMNSKQSVKPLPNCCAETKALS